MRNAARKRDHEIQKAKRDRLKADANLENTHTSIDVWFSVMKDPSAYAEIQIKMLEKLICDWAVIEWGIGTTIGFDRESKQVTVRHADGHSRVFYKEC